MNPVLKLLISGTRSFSGADMNPVLKLRADQRDAVLLTSSYELRAVAFTAALKNQQDMKMSLNISFLNCLGFPPTTGICPSITPVLFLVASLLVFPFLLKVPFLTSQ